MADREELLPDWIPDSIRDDAECKTQITQLFKVTSGLHKLQKTQTFCDVTIKIGDVSFHTHKAVLAAGSDFFNAMFTSGFQESHDSEAYVTGKPEAFQVLLDFAYSGKLNLSLKSAIDVLEMAHYLQFDDVVDLCKTFLNKEMIAQRVDIETAVRVLSIADTFGLLELMRCFRHQLTRFFKTSEPTEDFLEHVTAKLMEELMECPGLTDEKKVLNTAVSWLHHCWEDRKVHAPSLLKKIRLGVVPMSNLWKTMFKIPSLYSIPECKELIDKVVEMVESRKPHDPPLDYIDPSMFATRTTVSAMFFIGHGEDIMPSYYDTGTGQWFGLCKFPALPEKDCSDAVDSCCNAQGHLYVARGRGRLPPKLKCPQFLKYDDALNQWYNLAQMKEKRQNHPLVYAGNKIFAIGGDDAQSCEKYNTKENVWESMEPMLHKNIGLSSKSCAAYKDRLLIYAGEVGAREGEWIGHQLQMYTNHFDCWSVVMGAFHPSSSTTGLLVHDGKCYRIAGGDCTCEEEGCQWHQICVHELVMVGISWLTRTGACSVGEKQDQGLIPDELKKRAFRINQDVFVICKQTYHNTGIKITNNEDKPVNLNMWKNLCAMDHLAQASQYTSFTFDEAKFGRQLLQHLR